MIKVNLFKLRKNKRYNYTPRYFKGKKLDNAYEIGSKFEQYQDTYNNNDFSKSWQETRLSMRNRSNSSFSRMLLFIILILVFIFLYIIDFDLSIFNT